jgi:hypothetical protein
MKMDDVFGDSSCDHRGAALWSMRVCKRKRERESVCARLVSIDTERFRPSFPTSSVTRLEEQQSCMCWATDTFRKSMDGREPKCVGVRRR